MSKKIKKLRSEKRRAAKKARKTTNYLRFGPKQGHTGRRQAKKRYGSFRYSHISTGEVSPTPPSRTGRKRNRKGLKRSNPGPHIPKLPLRSLRKRRHICTTLKDQ